MQAGFRLLSEVRCAQEYFSCVREYQWYRIEGLGFDSGSAGSVRYMSDVTLRGLVIYLKELSRLSDHIHEAVDMLLKEGILEAVQQDIGGSAAEDDDPSNLGAEPATPSVLAEPATPSVLRLTSLKRPPNSKSGAAAKSTAKKRGRKCCTLRKRSWTAIEAGGASTVAVVKRLLLSATDFYT